MAGGVKSPSSQFRELTPEEYDETARLIDEGMSRNAIARKLKRSVSSITKMANARGRSFDRTATAEATAAFKVDAASRRAKLADDLLGDAEKMRLRLWEKHKAYMGGEFGPELVELELPPLKEAKDGVAAVSIALKAHTDLIKVDQGDTSAGAKSMLAGLALAFGLAAEAESTDAG